MWLLENDWCLMVVNKYSYRMCEKIKKYVKILLLEFLNEDHILHFFSSVKRFFFDKLYIIFFLHALNHQIVLIIIIFIIIINRFHITIHLTNHYNVLSIL